MVTTLADLVHGIWQDKNSAERLFEGKPYLTAQYISGFLDPAFFENNNKKLSNEGAQCMVEIWENLELEKSNEWAISSNKLKAINDKYLAKTLGFER